MIDFLEIWLSLWDSPHESFLQCLWKSSLVVVQPKHILFLKLLDFFCPVLPGRQIHVLEAFSLCMKNQEHLLSRCLHLRGCLSDVVILTETFCCYALYNIKSRFPSSLKTWIAWLKSVYWRLILVTTTTFLIVCKPGLDCVMLSMSRIHIKF